MFYRVSISILIGPRTSIRGFGFDLSSLPNPFFFFLALVVLTSGTCFWGCGLVSTVSTRREA